MLLTSIGLLSLVAWRWTLKPVITLFLIAAALGSYFMLAYGVVIDKSMIVNALQTDLRETMDLLNWRLAATLLVLAGLPGIFLWRQKIRQQRAWRRVASNLVNLLAACALLVLVLLLFFQSIASSMREHSQLRYLMNPLNSFYALGAIAAKPAQRSAAILPPLGEDARLDPSPGGPDQLPPLLLLVLGETARSGNFSINGYGRSTTPRLAQKNIASQRNTWSCGTSTAASVPCMFSNLGREAFDNGPDSAEGLLDVLQRAGLAVLWLDNQSGCKGVCDRVASASTTQMKTQALCQGGECFDAVMLDGIDQRIADLPAERRAKGVVVVMHQMGSHGPTYYKRSPPAFKKFLPECVSSALQSCVHDELINAYDNSIV